MYRDYPKQIYAIQHNVTGRIYIGSSKNVEERYWQHLYNLRGHKHDNKLMQKDFDKYGEDYSVYILDYCQDYSENRKEYDWMIALGTVDPEIGYNQGDRKIIKSERRKGIPFKAGLPIPNGSPGGDKNVP